MPGDAIQRKMGGGGGPKATLDIKSNRKRAVKSIVPVRVGFLSSISGILCWGFRAQRNMGGGVTQ